MPFSPWLTTLIGGRGSGKSTIVQMLRLALDRGGELSGDVLEDFENFARAGSRAEEDGALTGDTHIEVDYAKNGQVYRLSYAHGRPGLAVHEIAQDGTESPADGSARDFPVRIFGQKQIYHLAGDTRGLLSLIDETPEVDRAGWEIDWNKAIAEYRATRARARAERATTTEMSSLRHRLGDIAKQLEVFEHGDNRSVLQGYQRLRSQERHFEIRAEQSAEAESDVRTLLEELAPPDPPLAAFDGENPADEAGRELMRAATRDQQALVDTIRTAVDAYSASVDRWKADLASSPWSDRLNERRSAYAALTEKMAASGIEDPGGYTDLVRDKQLVESRLASAVRAERNAERIDAEAAAQLDAILELRKDLTRRRRAFLDTLPENDHVQVEIRGFGDSAESAEAGFRYAVGKPGTAFANDIRSEDDARGLLSGIYDPKDLPDGEDRDAIVLDRLDVERNACLAAAESDDSKFGAHFTRHLRELGAERLDHLRTWWPEDDVLVLYRDARQRFRPIRRASAGEKSAAVLAFILGHGEEPLILDQPEDDLDNHLIFQLVVTALGRIKRRRQVIVVTHNPNIVVNGASELVNAMAMPYGQIIRNAQGSGCLQDSGVRKEVCDVMEGGREAFERRYRRVVRHIDGGTEAHS